MKIFKDRRPRIACEFSSTQVVAARAAADGSVGAPFVCALPPGALTPDLLATNIPGRDAVRAALEGAKAKLGGRDREMAVILPDACFRMTLLDLDVLPQKHEEADALVRLRLRKSLPFEVGKARVCWQAQKANGKTTVLAAATLTVVLEEYESVVREAGFSPGLVLPSVLASLRVVDSAVPTLLIKVDPTTTGIAVVKDLAVVLVRILEGTSGQRMEGTRLAGEVHSSLMFLQDAYGTKVEKIVVSGATSLDELNKVLEASTAVQAQELVGAKQLDTASPSPPSVLGALSGALV
jgi:type IV pilus assembly protein PilM